jgi:hypothetical protein
MIDATLTWFGRVWVTMAILAILAFYSDLPGAATDDWALFNILPTSASQRSVPFSVTTGASDAAPSTVMVDANVDGASQGNVGAVNLLALKVEPEPTATPHGGGAGGGPGRWWAFFGNDGGNSGWTSVNSWPSQPIDGQHTFTDVGDGYWQGTGAAPFTPTPRSLMMTVEYGTPGQNYVDMGQAANGAYNATWLSWLQGQASAAPAPVKVVRIWQEINGDWMTWSANKTGSTSVDGTPNGSAWPKATIIAAWRNMAQQVRTAFPHAVIEWNLNNGTGWRGAPGDGTGYDLYPGDDLVDVIGIDAYEKTSSWATTVSGPGVNLNNLVAFATSHNKLIGWSETAAHNCDGTYLTSISNFFDSLGKQGAYWSYYDGGTPNNGDNILYATTGPDSCPANKLRAAMNASSFGQKPFEGTWYPR